MLIPTKKQWQTWSLPSKLTAVGTLVGIIGLLFALLSAGLELIESRSLKGSNGNAYSFYKLSLRGASIAGGRGAEVDGCVINEDDTFRDFMSDRLVDEMPFLLEIDIPNCAALDCVDDYFNEDEDENVCIYWTNELFGATYIIEGLLDIGSNSLYGRKWYDRYSREDVFQEFYQLQQLHCFAGFCTYMLKPYIVDPDRAASTFAKL